MYNPFEQIVIGIVSGIITYSLLQLFVYVVKFLFFPWIKDKIYDGVVVEGSWSGVKQDGDTKFGFEFQLIQSGHNIKGTFVTLNEYPDGKQSIKSYNIVGDIKNNYLLLSYEPSNKKTIGAGAFVFQVLDAGDILKGSMCYIKTSASITGAREEIVLTRKP